MAFYVGACSGHVQPLGPRQPSTTGTTNHAAAPKHYSPFIIVRAPGPAHEPAGRHSESCRAVVKARQSFSLMCRRTTRRLTTAPYDRPCAKSQPPRKSTQFEFIHHCLMITPTYTPQKLSHDSRVPPNTQQDLYATVDGMAVCHIDCSTNLK